MNNGCEWCLYESLKRPVNTGIVPQDKKDFNLNINTLCFVKI